MKTHFNPKNNPRVIIIQKLYGKFYNQDNDIEFPKHRFKKFIKDIAKGLLDSALRLIPKSNIVSIVRVPGVFEIPVTISKNIKKYDAFLALGCVIKGQTPHFDFISQASTNAIMDLSIINKKPIGNGIITCLNMKQAKIRRKKGAEAADAVNSVLSQK